MVKRTVWLGGKDIPINAWLCLKKLSLQASGAFEVPKQFLVYDLFHAQIQGDRRRRAPPDVAADEVSTVDSEGAEAVAETGSETVKEDKPDWVCAEDDVDACAAM